MLKSTMTVVTVWAAVVSSGAFAADVECLVGPALASLVQKSANERVTCLDSVTAADGTIRAVFFAARADQPLPKENESGVIVLDIAADAKTVAGQLRIAGTLEIFPNGCGQYVMGARVLPGSQKIALLYASTVVRILDFSATDSPVARIAIDKRRPNTFSTCQGYYPNWNAGRKDYRMIDRVKVDPAKREISEVYSAWDPVDRVQERSLTDAERAFYARVYDEECTGARSDPDSRKCQDLKGAADHGVYVVRDVYYPQMTAVATY